MAKYNKMILFYCVFIIFKSKEKSQLNIYLAKKTGGVRGALTLRYEKKKYIWDCFVNNGFVCNVSL